MTHFTSIMFIRIVTLTVSQVLLIPGMHPNHYRESFRSLGSSKFLPSLNILPAYILQVLLLYLARLQQLGCRMENNYSRQCLLIRRNLYIWTFWKQSSPNDLLNVERKYHHVAVSVFFNCISEKGPPHGWRNHIFLEDIATLVYSYWPNSRPIWELHHLWTDSFLISKKSGLHSYSMSLKTFLRTEFWEEIPWCYLCVWMNVTPAESHTKPITNLRFWL